MNIREKLKLIRIHSKKTIPQFSDFLSIPMGTLSKYSSGERDVSGDAVLKIIDKYPQYALWLTINEVAPEVGQISPDLEMPLMSGAGVPVAIIDDAFDKTIETSVVLGWLTPKEGIEFSMLSDLHRHNFVEAGGVLLPQDSTQEQSKTG